MRALVALVVLLLAASALAQPALLLSGAGATFPSPLYERWFHEYGRRHPEIRLSYQSIGSGGGIRQLLAGTVDFGASDVPLSEAEDQGRVLHVPTAVGAVAVVYNLQGAELRLTQGQLADLFLGRVARWSDPRLRSASTAPLPDLPVVPVHRADAAGTTALFTTYLARVAPEFRGQVGVGRSVRWPSGIGGRGSAGVAALVAGQRGAIGYVELAWATQGHLQTAALRNAAGRFVPPTAASTAAAAGPLARDLRASLLDGAGEGTYPIAAATYLLLPREQPDPARARALAQILRWALSEGQRLALPLEYAPLPDPAAVAVARVLDGLTSGGRPLGP